MDQILSAYGARLTDASKCPPDYARTTADGKIAFGTAPIAWAPDAINRILAGYQQ